MFKTCFAIIFVLICIACGNNNSGERKDGYSDVAKTPEDSLFQEVMDGHDEAMAKMGSLKGYRKRVEQRLDSISKQKGSANDSVGTAYHNLSVELKKAEDGMNQWMTEFQIDSAQDDTEKRIEYLSDEKKRVEKVRNDIFTALNNADSLLNRK